MASSLQKVPRTAKVLQTYQQMKPGARMGKAKK